MKFQSSDANQKSQKMEQSEPQIIQENDPKDSDKFMPSEKSLLSINAINKINS